MKKRFLMLALGLILPAACGLLFASRMSPAARAQVGPSLAAPQVSRAVRYAKTGAVRDFEPPRAAAVTDRIKGERARRQIRRVPNQGLPRGQNREGATHGTDAAVQDSFATNAVTGEPLIAAPEASFEGLSSDDNAAGREEIDLDLARRYADLGVHRLVLLPRDLDSPTFAEELIQRVGETVIGRV